MLAQHPDDYRWMITSCCRYLSSTETGSQCYVNALVSTPDHIVVGGLFTIPGNNIVLWEEHTNTWGKKQEKGVWQPPAHNVYPYIQCLYVEGDSVFVGGKFTMIDGTIPSSSFAIFNTRTKVWTASDTMIQGSVNSIVRFQGDIIIGGVFTIKERLLPIARGGVEANGVSSVQIISLYRVAWLSLKIVCIVILCHHLRLPIHLL